MGIVWVAKWTGLVFLIPKHMWKVKLDFQNRNQEEIFWSTLYSVQCTHIKVLEHSAIWLEKIFETMFFCRCDAVAKDKD